MDQLASVGHHVTVLDDLSTGKRENISSQIKLIVGDIGTPHIYDELIGSIDGCFHLAAIASVQRSKEEWLRTHQVNLGGTISLFDAIQRSKRTVPVVFASSAALYGDGNTQPISESAACQPLSAYGADKFACEINAKIASELHRIPTIGLRFFNVYGPRQDPSSPYSGVISIFANRMKQNAPITIYGDGEQSRDFVYVDDAVNALMMSMQKLESKKCLHDIFNICTGRQTSINQLAASIASITPSQSSLSHVRAREGDIRISLGSGLHAQEILGFNAQISLDDGLKRTLASL